MDPIVTNKSEVALFVNYSWITQRPNEEGPALINTPTRYKLFDANGVEQKVLKSGSRVRVSQQDTSTFWYMTPNAELGAKQTAAGAAEFIVKKISGSPGEEVRYRDGVLLQSTPGYWIGFTSNKQVLKGWNEESRAIEIVLWEYNPNWNVVPGATIGTGASDWCIAINMSKYDFHGSYAQAFQKKEALKAASTAPVLHDDITPGKCP